MAGPAFRTETIEMKPVLNHWIKHVPAEDEMLHSFSLQLHSPGLEELRRQFHEEIYNTAHPNHRQYLSHEQIAQILAVPEEVISELVETINSADNSAQVTIGPHGDYIHVKDMKVSAINEYFNIQLHRYLDNSSNKEIFRTEEIPTLPKGVKAIHRLFGDFFPKAKRFEAVKDGFPGMNVTPEVIRQQYNFSGVNGESGKSSGQGFAAFEQAEFRQSDVDSFLEKYNIPKTTINIVGDNTGGYYGEASLDAQYITGVGSNIETYFIYQDALDMLSWGQLVQKQPNPPKVLSVSWGSGESGFQKDHMTAASDEMMKMGAQGYSIFIASGDQGTGSTGFIFCGKFDPNWPASSPYVTAVGGTYITSETSPPAGWNGSGGGFSTVFTAPSYQTDSVSDYMNNSDVQLPHSSYWTKGGRAIPDVSTLATNFQVYSHGWGELTGTSAATPTFAGIIALINDKRVGAGKPELGFLNQDLYNLKSVGTDVTTGENKCSPCGSGFKAASGWDPITGLGVPDYPTLEQALTDL